jgi:hypothetical protein
MGYSPSSSRLGPFKWYQSYGHRLIEGLTTWVLNCGSSCVQRCWGKPPFFDGISYDYWKRKMKMYLGSINDQVWEVTEKQFALMKLCKSTGYDFVILDPDNLTNNDKANKQCNIMALNTIYNVVDIS